MADGQRDPASLAARTYAAWPPETCKPRKKMGTLSSRSMPPASHRTCARTHVESAQRAWTESGPLATLARARLADIVARVSSWPDTIEPLCEAPLPGNARPDVVRYPYTVPLTKASADADALASFGVDVVRAGGAAAEPATRGRMYEDACAALWHYVRVVLPELEVHPRCPGADIYDAPDRLRLMVYRDASPSASSSAPDHDSKARDAASGNGGGGISLAYGFATAWEAGALQRAAAFLAARRKRRAMQSPRLLARTGWLSTRNIKPDAIRGAGYGDAATMSPHPRLVRDRSTHRHHFVPHRFDDDGDDDGDDNANDADGGFYVDVHGRLSTKKHTSKDDSCVARERDPYNIRNPPALWWRQRSRDPDPMDVEDRDRPSLSAERYLRDTRSDEVGETDIDSTDSDDDASNHKDAIDAL
ncbi:hypothetical protein pneo_cds_533 [Pandoravirus neocaledonia]|uniref:Uncharacterized protein n=1 Tax=Pandoravirus neocaledonia TaxID=2107708 RepID=A0A2U7UCS8_9VIRU|nr:hypothetical protein pneo_cds_533 [Pandoravirus neocaledonia]AVK76140.1 hypothetical protein pneo_cds_533 [Pandoravirus neocaledonia]